MKFTRILTNLILLVLFMLASNIINAQCEGLTINDLYELYLRKSNDEKIDFLVSKGFRYRDDTKSSQSHLIYCDNDLVFVSFDKSISFIFKSSKHKHLNKLRESMQVSGYIFFDQRSNGDILFSNGLFYGYIANLGAESFQFGLVPDISSQSSKWHAKRIGSNGLEVNSITEVSNIYIKKGETVTISASGSIRLGYWAGSGGPNGISGYNQYNRVQRYKHGALLVRIGKGSWKAVGTGIQIRAYTDGMLQFMVNDKKTSDNSGYFTVKYKIIDEKTAKQEEIKRKKQIEAQKEAERKRIAKQKEAERKELKRINRIKNENAVTITGNDATKFINACVEYMLTTKHKKGFYDINNRRYVEELKKTTILQRKKSSKNIISDYLSKGASSQINNFISSLEKYSTKINDLDDYQLVQMVYKNMESSFIGFNIEQIKGNLDLFSIADLITKEREEEQLICFVNLAQSNIVNFLDHRNRWGLKSSLSGKVVIRPIYSWLNPVSEGLVKAKNTNGMVGFLDEKGNVVIPFIYKGAASFRSGLAAVTKNFRKWGYINKNGKLVISYKYATAGSFDDKCIGVARVKKSTKGKYFYINTDGKTVNGCE